MSWTTWNYDSSEKGREDLEDKILALMEEVSFELDDPDLEDWFDAGINLVGTGYDEEEIIVYYEIQEDGNQPGYTLTYQMSDGQQDTETFFADEDEKWKDIAAYFADRIIKAGSF